MLTVEESIVIHSPRTEAGAVKVAGRHLELTDEMVEVETGRKGKLVSKDATIPYPLTISYDDEGDGTKITWHQEMESPKGFFKLRRPDRGREATRNSPCDHRR